MLRSWEKLGLARPRRSRGHYRLYTHRDVQILKRARYLRRVKGLNATAIVEQLRAQGMLAGSRDGAATAQDMGQRLRRLRLQRGKSLAAVAGAAGISVGFLSALERSQMSASVGTLRRIARFYDLNILDFFDASAKQQPLVRPAQRKRLDAGHGVYMELLAGATLSWNHICSA